MTVDTTVAFSSAVVLPSMLVKSAAAAVPASIVTPIAPDLLIPAELSAVTICAAAPVIIVTAVALTNPVVAASIAFKLVAVATPADTVTKTAGAFDIPAEAIVLAMSVAIPVSKVVAVASTNPVVMASIVLRLAALTVISVTLALAIELGAFETIASNCAMVAVLLPEPLFIIKLSPLCHTVPKPLTNLATVLVTFAITPE